MVGAGNAGIQLQTPRGFTLLELLVVMVLATLLVTLVPSSFSTMVPHVAERSDVQRLVLALRTARADAIRDRREVSLELDMAQRRYHIPGKQKIEQLPERLAISYKPPFSPYLEVPRVTIRFYADGSSSGGKIELVSAQSAYHIAIDWMTGRVDFSELS